MKKAMVWMVVAMLAASAHKMRGQGNAQTAAQPQGQASPQPERKPLTQGTQAPASGKLVGNWQGTLEVGQGQRVLIKVTSEGAQGAPYKGTLYLIDSGGRAVGVPAIALHGTDVDFAIAPMQANYTGTLNPDGSSIGGSVKMADGSMHALNLSHVSDDNAWAIPEPPKPMPADANPKFDVVTVKPSDPNTPGKLFTIRGRHVMTINTTVSDLITFAYSIQTKQLVNGPAWLDEKYDIDGVPDVEGRPNIQQMRLLIRDAMVQRFGLEFHTEQRELAVYALMVAKAGPKMTVTTDAPSAPGNFLFGKLGQLHVTNSTMKDFCRGMQEAVMDKPVVDQTGLTDRYDFNLNWTPDQSQFAAMGARVPPPSDDPNAPPSLYTALQEQLGLKLETTKAMVDTFVIDQIEKPSPN